MISISKKQDSKVTWLLNSRLTNQLDTFLFAILLFCVEFYKKPKE